MSEWKPYLNTTEVAKMVGVGVTTQDVRRLLRLTDIEVSKVLGQIVIDVDDVEKILAAYDKKVTRRH